MSPVLSLLQYWCSYLHLKIFHIPMVRTQLMQILTTYYITYITIYNSLCIEGTYIVMHFITMIKILNQRTCIYKQFYLNFVLVNNNFVITKIYHSLYRIVEQIKNSLIEIDIYWNSWITVKSLRWVNFDCLFTYLTFKLAFLYS